MKPATRDDMQAAVGFPGKAVGEGVGCGTGAAVGLPGVTDGDGVGRGEGSRVGTVEGTAVITVGSDVTP